MDYVIICTAAVITSGLTLFSGFGLGSLLMPVFAIFFPIEAAVALTALVHLFNNFFKLAFFGKHSNRSVLIKFALPAILAAIGGAYLLTRFAQFQPLYVYQLGTRVAEISIIKIIIAVLIVLFSLFEMVPKLQRFEFDQRYLILGGTLSGFFGGLSGHQGALRSAFLVRCGLTKEAFIGTGVTIACLVDFTRISVYSTHFALSGAMENIGLLAAATLSAFLGVFVGSRLVKKVSIKSIQIFVSVLLLLLAIGLGTGIV